MRIATTVYTVVHDASNRQKSLLTHADAKSGMQFLASAPPINPKNILASVPLAFVRMNTASGATVLPALDEFKEKHRWIGFTRWWKDEPIYSAGTNSRLLSRMNLTFALRNKEGGSHWDAQVHDESYVDLSTKQRTFFLAEGAKATPVLGYEQASMRQIGWELLESLTRAGLG